MRSHQILLLAVAGGGVSGCTSAPLSPDNPDALVVHAPACDGLTQAACRARPDCHAVYGIVPKQPAVYSRCTVGPALCAGGCGVNAPYCEGIFVNSYQPDGCPENCVRATDCSGCRPEKMDFTQATGCSAPANLLELCIAPSLVAAVQSIAPTLHCIPGTGTAKCDAETELLCQLPTQCANLQEPLSDDVYATVCRLSTLPEVAAIVRD